MSEKIVTGLGPYYLINVGEQVWLRDCHGVDRQIRFVDDDKQEQQDQDIQDLQTDVAAIDARVTTLEGGLL